jgi:hypothetical protein
MSDQAIGQARRGADALGEAAGRRDGVNRVAAWASSRASMASNASAS